ncbi:MAG TPA: ISNCY family transposase [Chloroflexota bacterium]|nr:ISNCY family transposase [Chloroflexota bacterium]
MNEGEHRRLLVLNEVNRGRLTAWRAGELLGLSERQVRRILAAYREEGAAALVHGNRGRRPSNALDEGLRQRVAQLARTKYAGFNQLHMTEMLAEEEKLEIGRTSIRRILLAEGIASLRKRRAAKHRTRRERYPVEGMLLQIDGSSHDWLSGRGPAMCLVAGIDDATSTVPFGVFRPTEDTIGYFLLIEGVIAKKGRPTAVYRGRHSIFETSSREPTLSEQLRGRLDPTQFGRMLQELEIESIPARSPQAMGRIERLWGTFQDRLVAEMRLKGISDIDEANRFLPGFLARYNRRFAVPASEEGSAYRPLPEGLDPERVFCFKHTRTVGADNVVAYQGRRLQILPSTERASYARLEVEVHEHLDGRIALFYRDRRLAVRPAPAEAAELRSRTSRVDRAQLPSTDRAGKPAKPPGNPAWGRTFKLRGSRPNRPMDQEPSLAATARHS